MEILTSGKLTAEKLKEMQSHEIIKTGSISVEDYWDTKKEMLIDFVAVRGYIEDWAIYYLMSGTATFSYILSNGDKMTNEQSIKKCVLCDDEAFKMYRY